MDLPTLKYFTRFLKKYTWQECVLVCLMFLTSVGTLVSPYVLKIIIDDVFPSRNYTLLLEVLLIYLIISIARLVISYISTYMFESVSNHIMKDIRMSLFSHLIRLPLAFFDNSKAGDVIHRINSEVNSIQNMLTGSLIRLINSLCTLIGLTIMLCILNYKLFLISLCVFPLIYVNTRYFQPRIHRNIKLSRLKDSDILSFLMERFANIKILKSYVSYRHEEGKLDKEIDEQIGINMRNVRLTSTTQNISMFMTALVPILIFCFGGRDVMAGVMTVGSLVAFIQYTNRLFDPMRDLMGLYFDTVRVSVSMDRVYEVMTLPQEPDAPGPGESPGTVQGDIEFRNVSFGYDPAIPVLQHVDLTLRAGGKYALVGASGCGKSTVVSLLCRLYEPQQGTITVGGADIGAMDLASWRQHINLVTQDNHLFHDTIGNNIRYGSGEVAPVEMERAARLSQMHDHISGMQDGYDSMIGDRGVTLSGGQRQRIAIARSMLRPAQIVLLDEATSAVDSEAERVILQNVCEANRGRTIIFVSHRFSAIRDVDRIICLDQGRIVEEGTHDELISKRGYYWRLYKEQI